MSRRQTRYLLPLRPLSHQFQTKWRFLTPPSSPLDLGQCSPTARCVLFWQPHPAQRSTLVLELVLILQMSHKVRTITPYPTSPNRSLRGLAAVRRSFRRTSLTPRATRCSSRHPPRALHPRGPGGCATTRGELEGAQEAHRTPGPPARHPGPRTMDPQTTVCSERGWAFVSATGWRWVGDDLDGKECSCMRSGLRRPPAVELLPGREVPRSEQLCCFQDLSPKHADGSPVSSLSFPCSLCPHQLHQCCRRRRPQSALAAVSAASVLPRLPPRCSSPASLR